MNIIDGVLEGESSSLKGRKGIVSKEIFAESSEKG